MPTRSTTFTLNVQMGPDFTMSASPSIVTLNRETSGSTTISITRSGGHNLTINLSASGVPSGTTHSFTPSSLSSTQNSSTLSFSVGSSTTPQDYTITVSGSDGYISRSTTVGLSVIDFTVSVSPTTISIPRGSSGTVTASVTGLNNHPGPVVMGISGVPSGVSVSWTPSTATSTGITPGQNATISLNVSLSATTGTYTITVSGTY